MGDSVSPLTELAARRRALLEAANAALDSAFRHGARDVEWMGLEEQRRAARRAPTLRLAPERLQTAQLVGRRVEAIPEPLWSELRQLAALAGARLAVAPAAARITGGPGAYLASYLFVVVDVRLGRVVWRSRAQGAAAATPEAALQAAAGTAFPEVIR